MEPMKKNKLLMVIDYKNTMTTEEIMAEARRKVVGRLFRDVDTGRIYSGHFVELKKVAPAICQKGLWYYFTCYYVPLDVTDTTLEDV